ncbi:restriction endonuclease subunit S [Alteromonas sp. IB21]|uniref:restriction endonuclease subunit S n=1 Tax=Alteromonas sp. IB21 TaxID=2779369 RepID=UPI0018E8CBA4|nr:restriction endonuclease subunit S [Alteromonas sp. IB21]MBJ2129904.1 restriction endonuclease subunit S [Alteromonas sp. IB21]MCP4058702.1 hypothetical protein [Pseudoalteromonas sp.]MCP4232790.1 hypothetical protein [Aestuariibacter sp.]
MEQVLYKLPDGWKYQKLKTLIKMHYGKALKATDRIEGEVPVYGSNGVVGSHNEHLWDQPTVVIGRKGSVGEANLAFTPSWTIDTAYYVEIIDHKVLNLMYFYYFADRFDVSSISQKGVKPGINRNDYLNLSFPLPPINEQERIVEKLDTLLTRIDTAIENLQESIRLADALFSSALNRVFNPSGTKANFDSGYSLPEGWDWRTVNDLSTKIQYGHTAKAADKGNAQFLRITDIQDNNIDWLGVPFVDLKEKEIEKYALKDNDLVFARSGATAGKSILIKEPPQNAIFASYLIRIVPDTEAIQPEYLELFFKSPAYWDIVKANAAGAAQPNINGTKLGEFKVPAPSMETQKRIVDEMSSLSARVTELKKELRDKIYVIESAKSSILNSAFKGEL